MILSDPTRIMAGILLLSLITVESGGALMFRIVRGRQEATALQTTFFRPATRMPACSSRWR
jgi:hypothetical protein